jgi:hypothetical protein
VQTHTKAQAVLEALVVEVETKLVSVALAIRHQLHHLRVVLVAHHLVLATIHQVAAAVQGPQAIVQLELLLPMAVLEQHLLLQAHL